MQIGTWKKFGTGAAIAALVLILLGLAAPRFLDLNRYHDLIVSELEKGTGGRVTLGNIRWGLGRGLWLEVDEFSISNAPAISGDLRFTRIYALISIPPLLTKTIAVEELQLKGPEVRIRLGHGTREKEQPADAEVSTGIQLPVEVEIAQLAVAVDRFEVSDGLALPGQTLFHVFSDAALSAIRTGTQGAMAFTLSLRDKVPSGLGSIKARGTLSGLTKVLTLESPELRLQATLDDLSAEAIDPYLKSAGTEGRLSGSLSMQFDYVGDLGRNLRVHGSIDLDRLSYADPYLWDGPLTGRDTTLAFNLTLDPKDLTVEKIAIRRGALALDAQGLLHDWNTQPSIRATGSSSALPLRDLAPLVPWKQIPEKADLIRTIFEDGGEFELGKLALAGTPLEKPPATPGEWLSRLQATARVTGVSLPAIQAFPAIRNIMGTVQLLNGGVQVEGLTARLASVDLPPVSGEITDLLDKPKIHARMSGAIDLNETTDQQVYRLLKEIGAGRVAAVSRLEKAVGAVDLDLALELDTAQPTGYLLRGNVGFRDFSLKSAFSPALFQAINADIDVTPTVITISRASAIVALPDAAESNQEQLTLDLQARIDDWKGMPSVMLEALKTSRISLPILSPMIPWEQLDPSTREIEAILRSGGSATISTLALPAIELSGQAPDPKPLLAGATLAADLDDLSLPRGFIPTGIEGISGQVTLAKNLLLAERIEARIGPVALPESTIRVSDVAGPFKLAFSSKGALSLTPSRDQAIEELLLEHGLTSLDGSAEIDVSAGYDQHHPDEWTAEGSLNLKEVSAITHPEAVALKHLTGQLRFHHERTLSLSARDISAQIDGVPLQLSGEVSGIGSPNVLVDARAITRELDLARMAELVPMLKDMQVHGVLDLDADVHVPYSNPDKIRLKGTFAARDAGLRLAPFGLAVSDTDMDLMLAGKGVEIKRMITTVNEQKLSVSGRLSNPVEPDIKLALSTATLDIDRLFPPDRGAGSLPATPSPGPRQEEAKPRTANGTRRTELPTLARKTTADIELHAGRGQYGGLEFEALQLNLLFKHGVIERYKVDTRIDGGVFSLNGSADLRDPDRLVFMAHPDIVAAPLDTIAPLIGNNKLPISGPLTLKGQLRGNIGSGGEVAGSLDGKLAASLGRGTLSRSGRVGHFFEKLFSMIRIRNIFSGRLLRDLSSHGVPFESITAQLNFEKGTLGLDGFRFSSDAMTIDGQGTIDLVDEGLKFEALLVPLVTMDDALNLVPLFGDALKDVSRIQIHVEGSLDEPRIHMEEAREIGQSIETEVEQPTDDLEDVGKGLEKIF